MSATDDTNAARRGSESNDLLGPPPEARCLNVPMCGCQEAGQQCAAREFAHPQQWKEFAKDAGWRDLPTVRLAFAGFDIAVFAAMVAAASRAELQAELAATHRLWREDSNAKALELARLRQSMGLPC